MRKSLTYLLIICAFFIAACSSATPTVTLEPSPIPELTPLPEPAPIQTSTPEAYPSPTVYQPPVRAYPEPGEPGSSGDLRFVDDLGVEVVLNGPAQQIVTLGPSIVETLFAIGAGSQIVGREDFSTFPPEAIEIPSIGSTFGGLPTEAILALEPDLVIAPQIYSAEQVNALRQVGLTVYYQNNPTDFDSLYANILRLGELTGKLTEAEILNTDLSNRVAAVLSALEAIESQPKVFYELDATDPQNPYTTGAGTFIDVIIGLAGGENIGKELQGDFAQMSSEEIILQNPDVILLADAEYGVTIESVEARPGWDAITAIVEDKVFPFSSYLLSVPGPRLVDGLEEVARLLHPDRFPSPN